jgi:hypothetical protein
MLLIDGLVNKDASTTTAGETERERERERERSGGANKEGAD